VISWFFARRWIINEYIVHDSSIVRPQRGNATREFLANIYREHTNYVREFVEQHPSHAYVEVNIEDPNAGVILADAFGLDRSCWGHHNKKETHDKLMKKGQ
jgi:hypothetical protein